MENGKCVALGEGLCLCFHKKRKAVGSFQVDKKSGKTKGDLLKTLVTEKKRETNTINKIGDVYLVMFVSLYM